MLCSSTSSGFYKPQHDETVQRQKHTAIIREVADRLRKDRSWKPTDPSVRERMSLSGLAVLNMLPALEHSSFVDALTIAARWNLILSTNIKSGIAQYINDNSELVSTEVFFEIVHYIGHIGLQLSEAVLRRLATRGKELLILAEAQEIVYYIWFWSKQPGNVEALAPGTMKDWFELCEREMDSLTVPQTSLTLLALMRCTPPITPPLTWWLAFVARILSFKDIDARHAAMLLWAISQLVDKVSASFSHPYLQMHIADQFVSKIESCKVVELYMALQAFVLLKLNPRQVRQDFWVRFACIFERTALVRTLNPDHMGGILSFCHELNGKSWKLPPIVWDRVVQLDVRQADLRTTSYLLFNAAKFRVRLPAKFLDLCEQRLTELLLDASNELKWMAYAVLALGLFRRPVAANVWQSVFDALEMSNGPVDEGDFYLLDTSLLVHGLVLKQKIPVELVKLLLSKWDRKKKGTIPIAILRMRFVYGQRHFPADVWQLSGTKEFRRIAEEYTTEQHGNSFEMNGPERSLFDALRRYFHNRSVRAQVVMAEVGTVVDFVVDFDRHPSLVVQLDGALHFIVETSGLSTDERNVLTDLNTALLKRAGFYVERISAFDWASRPDSIMRSLKSEYGLIDEKLL